ncbi:MAG: hypothetical protein QW057_10925 [Candidatus Bathyarchaeia archaeon]
MKDACSECGVSADVKPCQFCGKLFCEQHYDAHVLWERKHEVLAHRGGFTAGLPSSSGPSDLHRKPHPPRRRRIIASEQEQSITERRPDEEAC